jgi:DNA-binding GntR family transcriptional regulator
MTVHREFHRAIYTASHDPLLIGILEGPWDKADRYRQIGLQSQKDSGKDRLGHRPDSYQYQRQATAAPWVSGTGLTDDPVC